MMLLAEIDIPHLKDVSSQLWNRPLDSDIARFYFVEVVGMVKGFHLVPHQETGNGYRYPSQTPVD